MSFQAFSYFYKEAQHCADKEGFVEGSMSLEHNNWAPGYSAEEMNDILDYIYELAHCSTAALRKKLGLIRVAMADIYINSKRMLLAWGRGEQKISDMDKSLVSYVIFTDVSYISSDVLIV